LVKFFSLLISGFVSGGIYSIMASGLVLTYETSGIFNFAQGAIAFVTAYVFFQLNTGQHIAAPLAAVLSVLVFAPLLGLALDRILLQRLSDAPMFARIVGTIGLFVALPNLALWLVETVGNTVLGTHLPITTGASGVTNVRGLGPHPPSVWHLGFIGLRPVSITSDELAVFAAAALSALVLWFVLRRTQAGLSMRAVVDKKELASLRGVNPSRSSALAWLLSTVLAGLGGILLAPLFQLDGTTFTLIVFGSLAAVAFAGLRSIPLAFAAGLALGVVQDMVAGYGSTILPPVITKLPGFQGSVPFVLTVLLLFFAGRERGRAAATASDEHPPPDHREGLSPLRRRLPWVIGIGLFIVYIMGWFTPVKASGYSLGGVLAPALALGLIFLSFVVTTGIGGMVSLAQATFVTAGGFCAGWALNHDWGLDLPFIATHGHLNFLLGALAGGLIAAAVGALIALPVRRLGALPLALGTIALALVADLTVFNIDSVRHGQNGWSYTTPKVGLFGIVTFNFGNPRTQVLMLLALFGLMTLFIYNLQHSATGRAMYASRSSDVAARTVGLVPAKYQIALFAFSGAIAGLGGVMLGMINGTFTNTTAPALTGLIWLAVAVTWGVRRPGGALLAGISYAGSAQILTWVSHRSIVPGTVGDLITSTYFAPILFGLGAIGLAQNPDGVLAIFGSQRRERRHNKQLRAARAQAPAAGPATGPTMPTVPAVAEAPPAPAVAAAAAPPLAADGTAAAADAGGPMAPALDLRSVTAGYGELEVLHDVSVAVPAGAILAVVGANGAGKSTLCGVAVGLVAMTGGEVRLAGDDVSSLPPHARVARGLMLAPEGRGIFPGLTVEENLKVLLHSPAERDVAYTHFPALAHRRYQLASSLSGGEQQMLSLSPAIVSHPRVLIADEPTLGLAPIVSAQVGTVLDELRAAGTAVLLVEEKANEILDLADYVAFIELGRVVWQGPRKDFDPTTLVETYLGSAAAHAPAASRR
jgi:ABC-type branched-subunit amino acid transport system ATPase component/branched-subunit amino acid ABC-type transport system permease component